MSKINSLRDEKTGRFQTTTNSSIYKMVQFNNRRMSVHWREFCIALNIPFIPKGFVVHHLDKNKKNNDINNLAIVTITAHNRIHSHEPWNKGVKTPENTIFKQRLAREKGYLTKFKEAYDLFNGGMNYNQIGKKLNINRGTASSRVKNYKRLYDKFNKK